MSEINNNTGSFFAGTLKAYGITHVFYVPVVFPSAVRPLADTGVTKIMTHHEVAAAYMADGYARAARRPGICMAQQVGAANMAAGLREAFLASVPVIAVTGGTHPDNHYMYDYQVIEDHDMFRAVTKFNVKVEKPGRLPDLLRQAFREAMTGTPGPAHLELPGRMGQGAEGPVDCMAIAEPQFLQSPPYRPACDRLTVEKAVALLSGANRPVIVAGGGVIASGAEPQVMQLAERLSIPVATSSTGKGALPENHPLALGVMGSYGRRITNHCVREADFVFFIGSRIGDMTSDHYTCPSRGVRGIQLDINPAEIGRVYPVELALPGDARTVLGQMLDIMRPRPGGSDWVRYVQDKRDRWLADIAPQKNSDAVPIRPERLCKEITEFLPEDAVLVSDTGHAGVWTASICELTRSGQRFVRCFGTLGWAFPGSLGIQCGAPDRTVVCFTGDGGMYYHLSELETAARHHIPAIVVVNNNSAFSQVKGGFESRENGPPEEVYEFREINFARIADEMGCRGIRVERPEQIRPALEDALAARMPALIDVVTDVDVRPVWS